MKSIFPAVNTIHHDQAKIKKTGIFCTVLLACVVGVSGCQSNNSSANLYTVKSGDTLSGIAARYGLNYRDIARLNNIPPPYVIRVRQKLRLTSSNSSNSNIHNRALSNKPSRTQIGGNKTLINPPSSSPYSQQPTQVQVPVVSNNLRWVKPSNGSIIQQFNPNQNIKGIRYGGATGDPIFAAADGQVVYAADGLEEYGNLVLIQHIDGYVSAYAHNSSILVKEGANVSAGQQIARMGSSGTNRVMLEFQIRLNGTPQDPSLILR